MRGSAYCQSPETLGVLAPHIAVLPDRESDLIKVVDMIMTVEHERGSGLHDGAPIYVDGSQALGRQPWSCSILGCIGGWYGTYCTIFLLGRWRDQ